MYIKFEFNISGAYPIVDISLNRFEYKSVTTSCIMSAFGNLGTAGITLITKGTASAHRLTCISIAYATMYGHVISLQETKLSCYYCCMLDMCGFDYILFVPKALSKAFSNGCIMSCIMCGLCVYDGHTIQCNTSNIMLNHYLC